MKKNLLLQTFTYLLILLFVYTAVSKLADYDNFVNVLNQTSELRPFASVLATGLPIIEIVAAVLLAFPSTRDKGFLVSLLLMIAFTIYVGYVNFLVSHQPCACGGIFKGIGWKRHLIVNLIFTAIALAGLSLNKTISRTSVVTRHSSLLASNE